MSSRSPRFISCFLAVTCITAAGCTDPQPSFHESDLVPGPANVSEPATVVPQPAGSASSPVAPQVYVSIPSQTFIGGLAALIRNTRTGTSVTSGMIAGGLDPVILEAAVGDTLEFTITIAGRNPVRFVSLVPLRKPPVVVRTDPPPQRRDVPLNSILIVVFSEPMDSATLSAASIKLTQAGNPVSGQLALAADGLFATFQPTDSLQASSVYTLSITTAVADLDGDFLAAPVSFSFNTTDVLTSPLPVPPGALSFTEGSGISLMTADGSFYRRLTGGTAGFDAEGSWSPDGGRIAFTRYSGGNDAEIFVMNADGTHLVRVSPAGVYDAHPTWSPDGTRIAFEHRPDSVSGGNIYVMNSDGTNRVQLTSLRQPAATPAWSPDGSRIAFMTYSDSGFGNLYLMNPDGTNLVPLMTDSPTDWFPAWSPDGSRIAWARLGSFGSDIFTINADGTNLRRLTTTGLAGTPSWAPDGLSVLFVTYSECEWPETCPGPRLWVARASDGSLTELFPPGGSFALYPSWQP